MKKLLLFYTLSLFTFFANANEDLLYVRNLFHRAAKSSIAADSLKDYFDNVDTKNKPELIGYKGMSKLMLCYHSYNPYTKYTYFLDGKNLLEEAIKMAPTNIELRFLRLAVQLNTPAFLGYSKNIDEDKIAICKMAQYITDVDLIQRIYNYTRTSKKLSNYEREKMSQALYSNKLAKDILQ